MKWIIRATVLLLGTVALALVGPAAMADASTGQIVYELGGQLHVYDTRASQDRAVAIRVPDDGASRRPERINVRDNIEQLDLSPGAERIAALGGLQQFTGWNGPMLTDSGGFQVMSLSDLRKVTEKAVTFRSHIDGAKVELSPERSIEVQRLLGSDIAMQMDECVRLPAGRDDIERARRTWEWGTNAFVFVLIGLGGVWTLWIGNPTWGTAADFITALLAGAATRFVVGDATVKE